jgi:hypothetical protein
MLFVYGDESMDERKQRVCAVAGIVGAEDSWRDLESKWIARTGGIPFHAKECDSDQGDYADKQHAENKALYKDLAILMAEANLAGFGVAIDLIAQQRVWPDALDISYYKAFLHVLLKMKKVADYFGENLQFTFDSRLESEHNAALLYDSIREDEPGCLERFASKVSFQFSKDNPRIQVADLFARETMKALDNIIGPTKRGDRKSWLALHGSGKYLIEAYGNDWFDDLKRNYGELGKKGRIFPERLSGSVK